MLRVSNNGPVSIGALLQHAKALWMAAAVSTNGSSEVRSLAELSPSAGDRVDRLLLAIAALDLSGNCGFTLIATRYYCSPPM